MLLKGVRNASGAVICAMAAILSLGLFCGCAASTGEEIDSESTFEQAPEDNELSQEEIEAEEEARRAEAEAAAKIQAEEERKAAIDAALAKLNLTQDFRSSFVHGEKPAEFQKYIVLHDTEGNSNASSVINWWDSNGAGVAAHFVVNKDGSIVQAVPLDKITHHAGYGDTGHNAEFGVVEDGRDDMVGTVPIGSWASDYGMNGSSIGIEIVHVGGSGSYPEAQLEALDNLIAYIDAYYGFESPITDHKAWRTGNSDTSPEFAGYLANYQSTRKYA